MNSGEGGEHCGLHREVLEVDFWLSQAYGVSIMEPQRGGTIKFCIAARKPGQYQALKANRPDNKISRQKCMKTQEISTYQGKLT